MQRKFEEFLKELDNSQYRVVEINQAADGLFNEGHPDREQIHEKRDEVNREWHELGALTATRYVRALAVDNKSKNKMLRSFVDAKAFLALNKFKNSIVTSTKRLAG